MRYKLVLPALLFCLSSLAAAADEEQIKVCKLLLAENLSPWGYISPMLADSTSDNIPMAEVNAPSDIHTDTCAMRNMGVKQRGTTFVVVDSFSADTATEAVAAWVKIAQAQAALNVSPTELRPVEVQIDDATCETGAYALPTEEDMSAMQHYVACDRVIGSRHLTVNVQQSDASKLPTAPQVKELLDLAGTRIPSAAKQVL